MELSLDADAGALGKVLASIPEFVLVVDRDQVIRYINRVEPGYDRSKVIGMRADAVIFAESKEVFDAALSSVFATGKTEAYEVEVSLPDGSRASYCSQMFPGTGTEPQSSWRSSWRRTLQN